MTEEITPTEVAKCVICAEPANHKKLGRDVCEYHYDLSNDHKRGR